MREDTKNFTVITVKFLRREFNSAESEMIAFYE